MADRIAQAQPTPRTTQVFVVIADSSAEHKNQRLGMFFRALDADAHAATLSNGLWTNVRIVSEQMRASDLHPAHASLSK